MTRQRLVLAGKLLVTGLLIALVAQGVEVAEVKARLGRLDPLPLAGAAGLIGLQLLLVVTWRWSRIIAAFDRAAPPLALLRIVVISLFFNQMLPSTVGGDGMRMWLLNRLGWATGIAVRTVIVDRLLGLFALAILSFLGALALLSIWPGAGPLWAAAAFGLGGMTAIAGAPLLLRVMRSLPFARLGRVLEMMAAEVDRLRHDTVLLCALIGVSLLGHLAISGGVWLLALSLDIALALPAVLAVVPAVLLIASLPISIAGWGVREGAMVVGLALLGVGRSDAALVSIFFGVLLLAFGLLGGVVWLCQREVAPDNLGKAPYVPPSP